MKFCSNCGHNELEFKIPDLDNLPRFCCPKCGTIFYSNPKIITGTISYIDNQVLLCKRAIQPRYGLWTLPAGFMENGETLENGAFRETLEETGTEVEIESLYGIFNIPKIRKIILTISDQYLIVLSFINGYNDTIKKNAQKTIPKLLLELILIFLFFTYQLLVF